MPYVRQITPFRRNKDVVGITSINLAGPFQKEPLVRNQSRDRDPRIIDSVLTSDQIVGNNRPIRPRQHMVMQCVDLSERRAHFSDPDEQATRHCRERDIALFEVYTLLTEG